MAGEVKDEKEKELEKQIAKRRKKNAARMEQLKAWGRFYSRLLRVFIVTLILCAAGLGYEYFWLARYERQSVTGAMNRYMKNVADHNWDEIYRTDSTYFTEVNTKENLITYLIYTYGDNHANGYTYSLVEETDTGMRYYDAYYLSSKVSTLETYKPEGSSTWKVRTVVSGGSYTFDVLNDAAFRINDVPISSSSFASEGDHIPLAFESLSIDDTFPTVTRYTVENLVRAPEPLPEDSENNMAVRDYSGNHYYIGPKPTAEQYSEFAQNIEDTAMAYSRYITKDGTFYDLRRHLYPNTEFYYAIRSLDNQYFSSHDSLDFQDIAISDVMPLGDDAFVGTISYNVVVTAGTNVKTYASTYQIFFVRDGDSWLATNLITITDDTSTITEGENTTS